MKTAVFFKAPPLQYPQSPRVGSSPHFGNPHTLTIHITYTMLALGWTPFAFTTALNLHSTCAMKVLETFLRDLG